MLEEVRTRKVRRIDRVPIRRFHTLFVLVVRPALCKIDVQGAKLMVLAGMTDRLAEIEALVIETSTIATVKSGAEVSDIVRFLGDRLFALADVFGVRRRPLDDATAQLDLLFMPNDAAPRHDRRRSAGV